MSEHDTSMSMNSLMEAIYGDNNSQYTTDYHEQNLIDYIPQFMHSLINYLIQLCVTQGFADNVRRTLCPWIRQLKINQRNPKPYIEGFLKDFLRLYCQQTQKINKYGEKKLKFLTKTVSKQIFTQIMRTACELKLQNVNRNNNVRSTHKKFNYLTILTHSIQKLFKNDKISSFKTLKKMYVQSINKEENFVQKFSSSINRLDKLCIKKKASRQWKAMSLWRMNCILIAQQESTQAFQCSKQFFRTVLPQIVHKWQQKPQNWVIVITECLTNLFRNMFSGSQDITVQFIPNPNLQQYNSLDYSAISSFRSGISQISSIAMEEYLKNEQIKYDNNKKFLAIPIIAEENIGLIKIQWTYQLPIVTFNRILKVVQLIKSIIQAFAKITTRLSYYSLQYQNNIWHEILFDYCFKQTMLQMKDLQQLLALVKINFLQIHHDSNLCNPCIKYGRENVQPIPQNIFRLIWDKLQTTSSFQLDREDKKYEIMKLQDQNGFCRYSLDCEQNQQNGKIKQTIIKCIVPLLTKNFGKIGCQSCNIKVNQLIPIIDSKISLLNQQQNQKRIEYDISTLMDIKYSKTVDQLEQTLYQFVSKSFPSTNLYARMLYTVSQNDNIYAYRSSNKNQKNKSCIQSTQIHKTLINQNICYVQSNEANKILVKNARIMYEKPLFQQSQMYIYQNQKRKQFKIIPKKIGRKGVLMVGTFQNELQKQIISTLNVLGSQIQQNSYLFKKKDLYGWVSDVIQKNKAIFVLNEPRSLTINQIKNTKFPQIIDNLTKKLPFVIQSFMWRVLNNKPYQLIGRKIQNDYMVNCIPFSYLMHEPVKSQQNVKGGHYLVKMSKKYGQKIEQKLTYIPNFNSIQEELKYAEVSLNCFTQQVCQLTDPNFNRTSQCLSAILGKKKIEFQFISVPIIHHKRQYIIMLVYNREVYIDNQNFQALSLYLIKTITDLLQKVHLISKQRALMWLKNNIDCEQSLFKSSKKRQIVESIEKFKGNKNYSIARSKKLFQILSRIYFDNGYKEKKYFICKINQISNNIKQTYIKNVSFWVNKLVKVYAFSPLLKNLIKIKNNNQGLQKLHTTWKKLLKNINCTSRISHKLFFLNILQFSITKKQWKTKNKLVSFQKIFKVYQTVYLRNVNKFFLKSAQNLISFKRSLLILKQQFSLMEPKSIKNCLDFLSGRLNLMISQHFVVSIKLKIMNCGYQSAQISKILLNQNFIFVQNSSFAFSVNCQGLQLNKEELCKNIQHQLCEILPKWQVNHRKHQLSRLKIIYKLLQSYKNQNMRLIYSLAKSWANKENINNFTQIKRKANEQKQKMLQYQYICNSSLNLQKRQKHKKQIDQLKFNTNIIQNQLHRINVESRIKSKTNAAYRMLNILNKNNCIKNDKKKIEQGKRIKSSTQEFYASVQQDRSKYIEDILPVWHSRLCKFLNNQYRDKARNFFNNLTHFYA